MSHMEPIIVIRGAGDLASGVAIRLFRSGFRLIMTELNQPLTVRRTVSFSEAIYSGTTSVEGVKARKIDSIDTLFNSLEQNEIPILVDEKLEFLQSKKFIFPVLIDARMEKKAPEENYTNFVPLVIGIGPGFTAGNDCHVVIESNRGHYLGHIYRKGAAIFDTGLPSGDPTRILLAPKDGIIVNKVQIGDIMVTGQVIASIGDQSILSPFTGLLRGLIHSGLYVRKGIKIGDLDHSTNGDLCRFVSDKALAIGGSVLEVILSETDLLPDRNKP